MVKILSIFCSLLLVYVSSLFIQKESEVNVITFTPIEVLPGDTFLVELTIQKGNVIGYANLQQYLPEGFTAIEVNSNHASFSFTNQLMKLTWIDLPVEESFKVSYKIQTDVDCNGLKTLNGEFSYMENNQTYKFTLIPSVIVLGDEQIESGTVSEINASRVIEKAMVPSASGDGGYDVKLRIKKGIQNTDVHIKMRLPEGFYAESIESEGGNFAMIDRIAEFSWTTMPDDSIFDIAYHIFNNKRVSDVVASPPEVAEHESSDLSFQNNSNEMGNSVKQQDQNEPSTSSATLPATSYNSIPTPQNGVYYKVQIAATRKSAVRNNDYFRTNRNITEPVDVSMEKGWKKYMIGTFDKYATAKQFNNETRTKIPDAFVVAYQSGVRVPLREAKKINQ